MDEMNRKYRILTVEQAYVKIRHYCGFQERTHQEVKMKLKGYGINWSDIDALVSSLIEDGFLNEERYAAAFVGGKFRIKKWGRKKIELELKKKQVSDSNIKKALREEINQDDYEETILYIIEKKWNSIKPPTVSDYEKQAKIRAYLFQRGFETLPVNIVMKRFLENK